MHHPENTRTPTGPALDATSGHRAPIVINVADVEPATALVPEVSYRAALDAAIVGMTGARAERTALPSGAGEASPIEACSDEGGSLIPVFASHAGLAAVHLAYAEHRPLALSPDIVWMFIAQGVALHVNANAETLRRRFVRHQGKVRLEVRRDEFRKGSPKNDWAGVLEEFSLQIREHIGESMHALLEPRFSTTGAVERAAAQVALLDALQPYFRYRLQTLCGIPQVLLHGDRQDWAALAERIEALREFDLKWWVDALRPIISRFVAAADGAVDAEFWRCIYKRHDGSGGPYISGWITALFPYLRKSIYDSNVIPNPFLRDGGECLETILADTGVGGFTSDDVPGALAEAPFEWEYVARLYDMRFAGGFVGVRQDAETLSVRPEIGWAVYEPERVWATRANREREDDRARRERKRAQAESEAARDAAVGAQWTSKCRCQRCGKWIYSADPNPPTQHCGADVVELSYR